MHLVRPIFMLISTFLNHKKYLKDDVVELMDNKNEKDERLVDGYKRTSLIKNMLQFT